MSTTKRTLDESNWRPRRLSTAVASALGTVITLGLGAVIGAVEPALFALLSGLCLGGTVWASAVSERRVASILTGVLAPVSGLTLLGAVALAVITQTGWPPVPPFNVLEFAPFVLVLAGFLSGFGAVTAIWGVTPTGDSGRTVIRLFTILSFPAAALVLSYLEPPVDPLVQFATTGIDLALARGAANEPITANGITAPRFGGFFAVVALSVLVVRLALDRVPAVELAPERNKELIESVHTAALVWLGRLFAVCGLLAGAAFVIQSVAPQVYTEMPTEVLVHSVSLTLSTTVRWTLLVIAGVSIPAICIPWLVRAVASERFRPDLLPLVPIAVSAVVALLALGSHSTIKTVALERAGSEEGRELLEAVFAGVGSRTITLAIVVAGFIVAITLLVVIVFAGLFAFLNATMGVQTVSAGVFVASVSAAIAEVSVPIVVAGVAASLLVWDLGEFAGTLGQELGRAGDALGTELIHMVAATVLAIGSVGVAVALVRTLEAVPAAPTAVGLVATVAAAAGTLLLFLVIR